MRVYLSSYRFGASGRALARRGGHALIVMNALDGYSDRLLSWTRETDDLAQLGYSSEELDLRDHWDEDESSLRRRLAVADLLWVVGGNAFVLARASTRANLREALRDSRHITYAGYSAGACLTSVDLWGIHLMDDPSEQPPGYGAEMSSETLQLIDTRVVPHSTSPEARATSRFLREQGLDFIEIADGDDVLIDVR